MNPIKTSVPLACRPNSKQGTMWNIRNNEPAGHPAAGCFPFLAHDLNNYLQVIGSHIGLARMQAGPGTIAEKLSLAEAGLQMIKLLLHQHLSNGRDEEDPITDIASLLHTVTTVTKFVLYGTGVRYEVKYNGELWPIRFRCNSFLRIFVNLLTNALEAMEGGGRITISIGTDLGTEGADLHPMRFLKIAVRDLGPGIAEEILPHIFTPGFSTKKHGRGLGLAFCREMIEKNGGRLEVASKVGAGATFIIYLPAISA